MLHTIFSSLVKANDEEETRREKGGRITKFHARESLMGKKRGATRISTLDCQDDTFEPLNDSLLVAEIAS